MENLRIAVMGNIGAGKSSFIQALTEEAVSQQLLSALTPQPNQQVHTFSEYYDQAVIDQFYEDPKLHAFLAQIEFLNGRLDRQSKIEEAHGIVLEDRTIFEDYHVFGKAQKILGNMNETQFKTYQRCYNQMADKVEEPDLAIYLKGDVALLKKRIAKRGRESEKLITDEYLELINNLYEMFVRKHLNCPVVTIDLSEAHGAVDNLDLHVKQIIDTIKKLNLRVTTPGIRDWVTLSETDAALRVVKIERKLEAYLREHPTLITVAGNVGLGKSTVTTLMHQSLRIDPLYERPEKNPLLEKFLQDKKKYCFDLQRHFLKLRAEQRSRGKQAEKSYVKDRSLPEDLLVFSQQFYRDGYLTANELDLLTTEFHQVNNELPSADLMIVLQSSSELAWQRIQQRARAMEMNGGWTFREINALNDLYRTYAQDVKQCGFHHGPIIEVNVERLDVTNRIHMGYLFERIYEALTTSAASKAGATNQCPEARMAFA